MRILVAGGTGTLGTRIGQRLGADGHEVRVFARSGGDIPGDVRQLADVARAVDEVDVVVSALQGFVGTGGVSPASVDHAGNVSLIDAATRAGAAFVMVSVVGARADHPMELFRAKYAAEQHLRASGAAGTIVRSTAFVQTWVTLIGEPLRTKGKTIVFGRGDNPINFVSATDVAALVARAATDPGLRGEVLEIGGSENITFNELVDLMQSALGQRGRVRHIPRPVLRTMANLTARLNPAFSRQARAAVVMDTTDMTFDSSAIYERFPDLPHTDIGTAVKESLA